MLIHKNQIYGWEDMVGGTGEFFFENEAHFCKGGALKCLASARGDGRSSRALADKLVSDGRRALVYY
jgi:hypothetical protein